MIRLFHQRHLFFYLVALIIFGCYFFLSRINYDIINAKIFYLLAIFCFYFLLYYFRSWWITKIPWWTILLVSLLFCSILISKSSLASSDLLYYNFHARVFTHYHQNPYLVPPENFLGDPFCDFVCAGRWRNLTNNYGPLWFYLTLIPSYLANNNYTLNILLMRLLAIIFFAASALLLYKIFKKNYSEHAKTSLYLLAFNPLFIFETAANGHNDAVLLFFIIIAIYWLMQKKYFLTYLALLVSFLIKFITLPLIIAYLIYLFCLKKKKIYICSLALVGIILVVACYTPIWHGLSTLNGLKAQNGMIDYVFNSPAFYISWSLGQSFFNLSGETIKNLVFWLFGGLYLYLMKKHFFTAKINNNNFFQAGFNIIFFLILIPLTWVMPWYFLWLFPWAIINRKPGWLMAFTVIGIVSYVIPIWLSFLLLLMLLSLSLAYKKKIFEPLFSQ